MDSCKAFQLDVTAAFIQEGMEVNQAISTLKSSLKSKGFILDFSWPGAFAAIPYYLSVTTA